MIDLKNSRELIAERQRYIFAESVIKFRDYKKIKKI